MTNEVLQKIVEFNDKAGLTALGYEDTRECAYPIEEALEQFDIRYLNKKLLIPEESTPKEASRAIITGMCHPSEEMTDITRFDKHLDVIVFSFGSLLKLGLSMTDIMRGLDHVMNANLAKLSVGKDSEGKQMKPENWIPPEELLEQILEEAKC